MPKMIFLTFDYEMFLRRSGSINKCILMPISLIIDRLKRNNIKAVFFIDILQLYMLRKNNHIHDFNILKDNILELLKDGHQIELHVHPHWVDAIYDNENNLKKVLNKEDKHKYLFVLPLWLVLFVPNLFIFLPKD